MNQLDHALMLADHGFHVFPLSPGEKNPPDWMVGYPDRATMDPEQLRRWWLDPALEIVQPYNPAISTTRYGIAAEHLFAIDVDVKEGKRGDLSLQELERTYGPLPRTYNQTTPSRGWHLLLRTPIALRNFVSQADRPGPLGPGIDGKSRGGFVVGAGAETEKGVYTAEWLEVAEAPAWLVELVGPSGDETELPAPGTAPVDPAAARAAAVWFLQHDAAPAIKGQGGDATTLQVAMTVKDLGVVDPNVCHELMLEHYVPRCIPPAWSPARLKVKVRNAYRYGKRGAGSAAPEVLFSGTGDPEPPAAGAPPGLPAIRFNNHQLRDEVDAAWGAVRLANRTAPGLFQRCGRIVWPRIGDPRGPSIERAELDWLTGHLSRIANWLKVLPKNVKNAPPPQAVGRDMIARPVPDLPALEAIGTEPVFTASGRLVTEPGYDSEARYYLHGDGGLALAGIPETPTDAEVAAAREILVVDLLGDFPFVGPADRAHALAALVLPLARRLIEGPTPLHVVEAPTVGTGKSLLAKVITLVATGRIAPMIPFPTTEEEWSKTLTTVLLEAAPAVVLDNSPERTKLVSASFAATLTSDMMAGRLLGTNTAPTIPNKALWMMTGNNPRLAGDWARRCVRVRINANEERPWDSPRVFRHPELLEWAGENRGELLRAVAVLVRAWLARGRPAAGSRMLGSFERWTHVVGGILRTAGVEGFLTNLGEMHQDHDPEAGEWEVFAELWWRTFEAVPVTAAQLVDLANANGLLIEVLGSGNTISQCTRMGRALHAERDSIHGGYRIERAERPHGVPGAGSFYRLVSGVI